MREWFKVTRKDLSVSQRLDHIEDAIDVLMKDKRKEYVKSIQFEGAAEMVEDEMIPLMGDGFFIDPRRAFIMFDGKNHPASPLRCHIEITTFQVPEDTLFLTEVIDTYDYTDDLMARIMNDIEHSTVIIEITSPFFSMQYPLHQSNGYMLPLDDYINMVNKMAKSIGWEL